ncbi:MAG: hypothetical protein Q7T21_06080 [Gallionella sp.]|nr:hypothetical protein [Gallionella sp.]
MMPFLHSAMARSLTQGWLMGISLFFAFGQVGAQSLRDPTMPPAEAGFASTATGGKSLSVEPGAMTVIVRGGRPYLAVGTRLYAQGQQLGQARIERISETEVWLREGGVLRKVSQFPGVQRRTVTPVAAMPVCTTARSSKTSSPVAPCADVQP